MLENWAIEEPEKALPVGTPLVTTAVYQMQSKEGHGEARQKPHVEYTSPANTSNMPNSLWVILSLCRVRAG
eukprot:1571510-Rhodomonas_salina.4